MKILSRYWKAVPPALAMIGQLVALGVLHGTALSVAQALLAAGALVGTVAAPANKPKETK